MKGVKNLLYSYDFIIKGNTVAFRCLDQDYILIDKEDMTHVLSAEGYWFEEESKIILKKNNLDKFVLLQNYIMMNNSFQIHQINNNIRDFRKNNLTILPHSFSPYFIRPSNLQSNTKRYSESFVSFSIKKSFKNIGYISFFPVTYNSYKKILNHSLSLDISFIRELSTIYENDSSYYHFAYGNFLNDEILIEFLSLYYNEILSFLKLRSIQILECGFVSNNPSFCLGKALKNHFQNWNVFGNKDEMKMQIDLSSLYR